MLLPGFVHRQVVVENAQRAMVVERFQQVECFEVIGTGLVRLIGADIEVAEIHEGVAMACGSRSSLEWSAPLYSRRRLGRTDQTAPAYSLIAETVESSLVCP